MATVGPRRRALRDLAAATPAYRNRYVDLLRAASIVVVVLGHWTVTAVTATDTGLVGENLLTAERWTHPLTWLFQVMPVFFLVGGYANAASLAAARRTGTSTWAWLRGRALRLLRPTAVLLTALAVARVVAVTAGAAPEQVALLVWAASTPLWFVAVYLGVVLLAPVAVAAHARWRWVVVVALVAAVAAGDAVRIATGDVRPAAASYLLAWAAVHQVGVAWHGGALPGGRASAWAMVGGGLAATVLLTGPGPYGVAMVGAAVPGDLSNTAPPTLALLTLATAQVGVVLLAECRARAWLERPRVWVAVIAVGSVSLTVFLWHMTALVVGSVLLAWAGVLPDAELGSGAWWVSRTWWVAVLGAVLAVLVAVLRGFEAPRAADRRPAAAPVGVVLGAALVLAAMVALGVSDTRGLAPTVGGVPVVELGLVGAGLLVLVRAGRDDAPAAARE